MATTAITAATTRGSCNRLQLQVDARVAAEMAPKSSDSLLAALKARGLRMTPQRRAIVTEVMGAKGHISPTRVARRVRERVPGVDPSTVYRTLDLLEELGVLSHAHLETGPEYHRTADSRHVHLTCSSCGADDSLSLKEAGRLRRLIAQHRGFTADFTHFAISGLCARCRASGQG
jgi:Fur family ferric uptake transcriptional regulator